MKLSPVLFRSNQLSVNNNQKTKTVSKDQGAKNNKSLPYIIGGSAALLITGYFLRNKISKIFKKSSNIQKGDLSSIVPNLKKKYVPPKIDIKEIPKKFELKPNVRDEILYGKRTIFKLNSFQSKPSKIDPNKLPARIIKPIFELKPNVKDKIIEIKSNNLNLPKIESQYPKIDPNKLPAVISKQKIQLTPQVGDIEMNTPINVCAGFDEFGKPIYKEVERVSSSLFETRSAFQEALDSISLGKQEVVDKIKLNRKKEEANITRIINENTHNGKIDIQMMRKIATDYSLDTNRGPDRYHQAADLLEQSYIKQFVKGDKNSKTGLYNLTDAITTDPVLYKMYTQMPLEESANRLNYLKENDLKSASYKEGIGVDGFFDKTFNRLVEKYQFKRYNEARGIE